MPYNCYQGFQGQVSRILRANFEESTKQYKNTLYNTTGYKTKFRQIATVNYYMYAYPHYNTSKFVP